MAHVRRTGTWMVAALLLALAVVALMPGTARADSVSYRDADVASDGTVTYETKTVDATKLTNAESFGEHDWYYVDGKMSVDTLETPSNSTIHLVLKDDCRLDVTQGIKVGRRASLIVYGQESGTGQIQAAGSGGDAAIEVPKREIGDARLTINGGVVIASARGGEGSQEGCGAGIGGSDSQRIRDCGTVTVNGGRVRATSDRAAGIGGGVGSNAGTGGTVAVNGGSVAAQSSGFGAGIGAGGGRADGGTLRVSNALVTALSGGGPGIGGSQKAELQASRNAVVLAGGLYRGILVDSLEKSNCLLVDNVRGEVCGTVRLPGNVQIAPQGASLRYDLVRSCDIEIPADGELVIPSGVTLEIADCKVVNRGMVTVERDATLSLGDAQDVTLDNTQGELVNEGGTVKGTPTGGSGTSRTHVTGVALSASELSLEPNGTATLTATVSPDNATDRSLSWQSDCDRVASVDANGTVTAYAVGTAVISAVSNDGGRTATCTVTVAQQPVPEPATYTVHWNANGGDAFSPQGATGTAQEGTRVVAPSSSPTKEASAHATYDFDGWYDQPQGGTRVTDFGMLAGDVTYYAHWKETPVTYTVTYKDGAGGTLFADRGTSGLSQGTQTPAFGADPTREGYVFEGWSPSIAATVAGDAVYTATWSVDTAHESEAVRQANEARDKALADLRDAEATLAKVRADLKDAEEARDTAEAALSDAEGARDRAAAAQKTAEDAQKAAEAAQKEAEDALKAAQAASGSGSAPDWAAVAAAQRKADEAQAKADAAQAEADKALAGLETALKKAEESAASEHAALLDAQQRETELKKELDEALAQVSREIPAAGQVAFSSLSVKGLQVSMKKGRQTKVSWKAPKGVKGLEYQVRYRASGSKKWKVKTVRAPKVTLKGLKAGKKYSFRVRGMRKIAETIAYTDWETVKDRARK